MSLKGRPCWVVKFRMVGAEGLSLEAMGRFVTGSEDFRFEADGRREHYEWVEQVLMGRQSGLPGKAARGLVRRYIEQMVGRWRTARIERGWNASLS